MFYNNGYLTNTLYNGGYLSKSMYPSNGNAAFYPCSSLIDFYYKTQSILESEVESKIDETYIFEITDELGVKLADGAQLIPSNYIKFKENYTTLIAHDTNNIFFDESGIAKILLIGDLDNEILDQYFFEFDDDGIIISIGLYSEALTDECLTLAQDFYNTVDSLLDSDGFILLDANGDTLTAPTV